MCSPLAPRELRRSARSTVSSGRRAYLPSTVYIYRALRSSPSWRELRRPPPAPSLRQSLLLNITTLRVAARRVARVTGPPEAAAAARSRRQVGLRHKASPSSRPLGERVGAHPMNIHGRPARVEETRVAPRGPPWVARCAVLPRPPAHPYLGAWQSSPSWRELRRPPPAPSQR